MVINEYTKWVIDNKEWLFSGAGVETLILLCTAIFLVFKYIIFRKKHESLTITEEEIKQKNIRDKALDIDKNTLPTFKRLINDLRTHLNEKTYIEYDKLHPLTLKFDSNIFIDNLGSSDIFKVENNQLILTYTQDAHLNQHMQVILKHLNDYHDSACKLKTIIHFLSDSTPPLLFGSDLDKIACEEFGKERVLQLNPDYKDYFAVYFITMTGSKNAYKDGHVFVIKLLKNRFEDLQSAIMKNDEDAQTIKEIQEELRNIKFNLDSAYDEIQKLHEVWQNKLIF